MGECSVPAAVPGGISLVRCRSEVDQDDVLERLVVWVIPGLEVGEQVLTPHARGIALVKERVGRERLEGVIWLEERVSAVDWVLESDRGLGLHLDSDALIPRDRD